jgi:DNA-binding CsgD family transcriptional regulator
MTTDSLPPLTLREQQVLAGVAKGATYHAIARELHISPHTVDTYLRRLRRKTGSANRSQLVYIAYRLGYEV